MNKSSGSVAPKERINIKYVPATDGEQAEVELPHKMLVLGDFGLDDARALEDRSIMRIDKHSFNNVLNDADVSLAMSVPSVLSTAPDAELAVNLQFKSINDFGPDSIAEQAAGASRGIGRAERPTGQRAHVPQATAAPVEQRTGTQTTGRRT